MPVDAARPNAKNAAMTDDAVMPILRNIQADLASVKADLTDLKVSVGALDRRATGQLNVLQQDVRMIRAALHDIGETRVTEGEITVLHEDVNRVTQRLSELESRVDALEHQTNE
jgi:cob(I)alamin adenosyltransferase